MIFLSRKPIRSPLSLRLLAAALSCYAGEASLHLVLTCGAPHAVFSSMSTFLNATLSFVSYMHSRERLGAFDRISVQRCQATSCRYLRLQSQRADTAMREDRPVKVFPHCRQPCSRVEATGQRARFCLAEWTFGAAAS